MFKDQEFLIPAVTPFFLEKDEDWLENNFSKLKTAALSDANWGKRAFFLKLGSKIKLSQIFKKLVDLGYEKVSFVESLGEFSFSGSVLTIFTPGNNLFSLEFLGSTFESIKQKKQKPASNKRVVGQESFQALPGDYLVHLDHGIGVFRGYLSAPNSKSVFPDYEEYVASNGANGFFAVEYAPARQTRQPRLTWRREAVTLRTGFWCRFTSLTSCLFIPVLTSRRSTALVLKFGC